MQKACKDGKTETLLCLNDGEEVTAQIYILEKQLSTIDLEKPFFPLLINLRYPHVTVKRNPTDAKSINKLD